MDAESCREYMSTLEAATVKTVCTKSLNPFGNREIDDMLGWTLVALCLPLAVCASLMVHMSAVHSRSPPLKYTVCSAVLFITALFAGLCKMLPSDCVAVVRALSPGPTSVCPMPGVDYPDLPLFPLLHTRDYLGGSPAPEVPTPVVNWVKTLLAFDVPGAASPIIAAIGFGFLTLLRHPRAIPVAAAVIFGLLFAVNPGLASAPWFWLRIASAVFALLFASQLYPAAATAANVVWLAHRLNLLPEGDMPTAAAAALTFVAVTVALRRYTEVFYWIGDAGYKGVQDLATLSVVFLVVRAVTHWPVTHPAWVAALFIVRVTGMVAPSGTTWGPPPSPLSLSPSHAQEAAASDGRYTAGLRLLGGPYGALQRLLRPVGSVAMHVWVVFECCTRLLKDPQPPAGSGTPSAFTPTIVAHRIAHLVASFVPGFTVSGRLVQLALLYLQFMAGVGLVLLGVRLMWSRRPDGSEGWQEGIPARRLLRWLLLTFGLSLAQAVGGSTRNVDLGWAAAAVTTIIVALSSPAPLLRRELNNAQNPTGSNIDGVLDLLPVWLLLGAGWQPTTATRAMAAVSLEQGLLLVVATAVLWLTVFLLKEVPRGVATAIVFLIDVLHTWLGSVLLLGALYPLFRVRLPPVVEAMPAAYLLVYQMLMYAVFGGEGDASMQKDSQPEVTLPPAPPLGRLAFESPASGSDTDSTGSLSPSPPPRVLALEDDPVVDSPPPPHVDDSPPPEPPRPAPRVFSRDAGDDRPPSQPRAQVPPPERRQTFRDSFSPQARHPPHTPSSMGSPAYSAIGTPGSVMSTPFAPHTPHDTPTPAHGWGFGTRPYHTMSQAYHRQPQLYHQQQHPQQHHQPPPQHQGSPHPRMAHVPPTPPPPPGMAYPVPPPTATGGWLGTAAASFDPSALQFGAVSMPGMPPMEAALHPPPAHGGQYAGVGGGGAAKRRRGDEDGPMDAIVVAEGPPVSPGDELAREQRAPKVVRRDG